MKISNVNGQIKAELKSKDRDTKLKLIIHGWEFPKIKKGEDSKWLFLTLLYKSPIFSVRIKREPGIQIGEVKDIYDSLKDLFDKSKGSVGFKLSEPYLKLSVKIIRKGEFIIKGVINDVDTNSGSLKFEFVVNQKCMKKFLVNLKEIISKYKR